MLSEKYGLKGAMAGSSRLDQVSDHSFSLWPKNQIDARIVFPLGSQKTSYKRF